VAYMPRVVDAEVNQQLTSAGALVIEGPKACGKTETALQFAQSKVFLDIDVAAQQAVSIDPQLILAGSTPRLLDEWQREPTLWNHVRRLVDDRKLPGQFILTGSSTPDMDLTRHSGAGRFSFIRMRPMTLFESGFSSGLVSLKKIMAGEHPKSIDSGLTILELVTRIAIGGWPAQQNRTEEQATRANRDYLKQITLVDIGLALGSFRDPQKMGNLIKSLARNVASEVAVTVLAADAGGSENPLSRNTVASYLNVLDRLMITEDQPAWAPHLRSKAKLRSASKRHFVDPSLAVAAMSTSSKGILADMNLLGFLFESMVIRDLRVFAQAINGQVLHYRDNNGVEVDAIVQLLDGRWAAFEIKLGVGQIEEAAEKLKKFASIIDTTKSGKPAILGIICGTGFSYMRPDNIAVISIGALAP